MASNALLTNDQRLARHLNMDATCLRCKGIYENIDHIFRFCLTSKVVWYFLFPASKHKEFFHKDTNAWMLQNIKGTNLVKGRSWCLIFGISIDIIWQNRNQSIFEGLISHPSDRVKHILAKVEVVHEILKQSMKFNSPGRIVKHKGGVRWNSPPHG
ncbi:hypothetical protein JHK85_012069 [Glycine max]|nr:hypothetical protein JHK85_012069 [Glycine max]KAG5056740.1 hypothetical protein JHK86_011736 [Glycine max]